MPHACPYTVTRPYSDNFSDDDHDHDSDEHPDDSHAQLAAVVESGNSPVPSPITSNTVRCQSILTTQAHREPWET